MRRRTSGRPRVGAMAALGLGVVLAVAVGVWQAPRLMERPGAAPTATIYATAPGERRSVRLADGTQLDLSSGSSVSVSLDSHARQVAMTSGEVAFAVAHDPARPFTVTIGDRQVRDIGTAFDIRRSGPEIRVTVSQGEVAVAARTGGGSPIDLGAGRQLVHDENTGASTVRLVAPEEAFAWKQGRLIYRDQPLRVVVEDLNRYFPHAVRIEGEQVAQLRFTGVLTVDGEDATIRRLVALLPISASHVGDATVLKAREEGR